MTCNCLLLDQGCNFACCFILILSNQYWNVFTNVNPLLDTIININQLSNWIYFFVVGVETYQRMQQQSPPRCSPRVPGWRIPSHWWWWWECLRTMHTPGHIWPSWPGRSWVAVLAACASWLPRSPGHWGWCLLQTAHPWWRPILCSRSETESLNWLSWERKSFPLGCPAPFHVV